MAGKNDGARAGAGRPKGSTTRPQLRDFYSAVELELFIEALQVRALADPQVMKFIAEQLFGKAPRPLTVADGGAIEIKDVEITVRKK